MEYHFEVTIVSSGFVDMVLVMADDVVRAQAIYRHLCASGNTFGTSRKPLVAKLGCRAAVWCSGSSGRSRLRRIAEREGALMSLNYD